MTAPERKVAAMLRTLGIGYRAQAREMPGTPDYVLAGRKVALFVDGDFWHGRRYDPRKLSAFWRAKIRNTMRRDVRVSVALNRAGWSVVRVWESDLAKVPGRVAARLQAAGRG